jgi:spermidine/putrescine-binding protein
MSEDSKRALGRRTTLKLLGTAGITGLAGCTGGGGDGSDGGGDGGDGGDGGGGGTTTTAGDGGATTTAGPDLEDELTVYAPTNISPVARAFEGEFGVTVNDTVFPGPQVLAKFKSEAGAGEYNTSVVISAGGNLIWPSMRQYLQPVEDIEVNDKIWTDARRSLFEEAGGLGYGYPWATLIRGTPFNTNNVDLESEAPVSWDDLKDPQWEGSMITPPTVSGPSAWITRSISCAARSP